MSTTGMLGQNEDSSASVVTQHMPHLKSRENVSNSHSSKGFATAIQSPTQTQNSQEEDFTQEVVDQLKVLTISLSDSIGETISPAISSTNRRISIATACTTDNLAARSTPAIDEDRTTVMMRDIPNSYSSQTLEELFNENGFCGRYNFMYLPIDFRNGASLGYAFVNFVSPRDALSFMLHFEGFSRWYMQSPKVCHVTWTEPNQGLDNHVQCYRNSPVMHESVPDEFKPRLYEGGVRVVFPEPTKRIRKPRIRPANCGGRHSDSRSPSLVLHRGL
jgi:RNA recognition motif-containing protein